MAKDPKSGRWIHKPSWDFPSQVVNRVEKKKENIDTLRSILQKMKEEYNSESSFSMNRFEMLSNPNNGGFYSNQFANFCQVASEILANPNMERIQITQSVEEEDNHAYAIYEPLISEYPVKYKTLWVMRISE